MMIDRDIVRFCAIECRLQMSGELSVSHMVDAWLYAQDVAGYKQGIAGPQYKYLPTLDDVQYIGSLVEPNVNYGPGFRKVDVRVGYDIKAPWQHVPVLMANLMEDLREFGTPGLKEVTNSAYPDDYGLLTPEKFTRYYLEIHPWQDGNGRSSTILFNWLNGTLDNPVWAPNFWNDPRRTIGYGA